MLLLWVGVWVQPTRECLLTAHAGSCRQGLPDQYWFFCLPWRCWLCPGVWECRYAMVTADAQL